MDTETTPQSEKFVTTLGKAFALNLVGTAGVFGGMLAIGSLIGASQKRKAAKDAQETPSES